MRLSLLYEDKRHNLFTFEIRLFFMKNLPFGSEYGILFSEIIYQETVVFLK